MPAGDRDLHGAFSVGLAFKFGEIHRMMRRRERAAGPRGMRRLPGAPEVVSGLL